MIFGSLTSEQPMCHLIDVESGFFLSASGHNLGAVFFFFFFKPKDCLSDSAQGRSGMHGRGI